MKLTLLGTGDFRPDTATGSAGYMVQTGTTTLKLDFGRGNLTEMARAGVNWKQLDALLISHLHPDHIGDMLQFFQAHFVLHRTHEVKELTVYGPRGCAAYMEQFFRIVIAERNYLPEVKELFEGECNVGDMHITALPVQHQVDALGYRVEANGSVLCYTGDTGTNENLIVLAKNADVLLTECANPDESPNEVHMHPKAIAELAELCLVKQIVLTHLTAHLEERHRRAEQLRSHTSIPVVLGEDGMTIHL